MKTTILSLCIIAVMAITANVFAVSTTITYYGQVVDQNGTPLEAYTMGPLWDYEYVGVNPLIQLFCNGAVVDLTTIGAGRYGLPVNGVFSKYATFDANPGDELRVKAFLRADGSGAFGWSEILLVNTSGEPYNFGTIQIPEPSLLVAGLALLAFRRKK
jgi:hypothetical protein